MTLPSQSYFIATQRVDIALNRGLQVVVRPSENAMERAFHMRVFGPPALLGPDCYALKVRTKKQRALLVYLAVSRNSPGVSRDQLVDLLWPEVVPKRGRHSLSQGLTVIRGLLGADAIDTLGNH